MKAIVWSRPEGGIAITYPVGEPRKAPRDKDGNIIDPKTKDETEGEFLDRVANHAKASGFIPGNWVREANVEQAEIPQDRTFRDAWKLNGSRVEPDIAKAKEIHAERVAHLLDPEFNRLQLEQLKAKGDQTAEDLVEADLQALRAQAAKASADIQKAVSIDDLKAVRPA